MTKKKPSYKMPGYYWRLRKKLMQKLHDGDVVCLKNYPPQTRVYIIRMSFKDLPEIIIT